MALHASLPAAAQRELYAATAALAGIDHHAAVAIVACHDRKLLVADARVVHRCVGVQLASEEVEVRSELIVPAHLGLVCYGAVDVVVLGVGVRQRHVALHQLHELHAERALLALEYVGEHLKVVASGAEALAHGGIDV